MYKTIFIVITVILMSASMLLLFGRFEGGGIVSNSEQIPNVEIREGIQYITIQARGGYSPRLSTAQANIPTKLIMKTRGTYDCSLALVIRSIGYQKILSQNGEEIIDLGIPNSGTIQGLCSMGMYSFSIHFK